MDINIERFITPGSFLGYEIGKNLDLSKYVVEKDYNLIGDNGIGYYFFNSEIDVEITLKEGLVSSFDILLRNQENSLYLGEENNHLDLKNCTLDEMISYLNLNKLTWKFRDPFQQSVAIEYHSHLNLIFYFDCENRSALTLIHVYKSNRFL